MGATSKSSWSFTALLALVLAAAPSQETVAATLIVEVTGVEDDLGLIRVAVCTPQTFTTKHCPLFAAAPAQVGVVVIDVEDVPPGRYAVQAFHDEDSSGRLRRGLLGLPAEAIGFSRNARIRLGPPIFEDAAIDVVEPSTTTRFRLRHVGL